MTRRSAALWCWMSAMGTPAWCARTADPLARLPLSFEPIGAEFVSRGGNYSVELRDASVSFGSRDGVVTLRFEGAASGAALTGEDALPGRINDLRGNNPSRWRTDV